MGERLWWVDEKDREIGGTYRWLADKNPGSRHREIGVIIVRKSDQKVFFAQRAFSKKVLPGYWSTGCAGHIHYGETGREAVIREMTEELGLHISPEDCQFIGKQLQERPNEEHWKYWYVLEVDKNFCPELNPEEVQDGRFLSLQEALTMRQQEENFYLPFYQIAFQYLTNNLPELIPYEEPET